MKTLLLTTALAFCSVANAAPAQWVFAEADSLRVYDIDLKSLRKATAKSEDVVLIRVRSTFKDSGKTTTAIWSAPYSACQVRKGLFTVFVLDNAESVVNSDTVPFDLSGKTVGDSLTRTLCGLVTK